MKRSKRDEDRAERLAAQLRANLRRRKGDAPADQPPSASDPIDIATPAAP